MKIKQLAWLFFLVLAAFTASGEMTKAPSKPNMAVIIADDHGYYHMSPYRNTGIPTPNLQKLADAGLRFDRAYVNAPYCVPSRHSLFTGLNPDRHGVEGNHEHQLVKPGLERIVERMYAQGYQIGMHGKVEHCKNYLLTQGKEVFTNLNQFFQNRDKSKPLLFFKGYTNTHTVWPEANPSKVDPAKVILPPKTPDNAATRLMHSRYVLSVMEMDSLIGDFLQLLNTHLDMTNTLVIYTSDHGQNWLFGKWTLNETGVRTPLIAVWPGIIQPKTNTDAMVSWVDLIPTFIDIAGGTVPDTLAALRAIVKARMQQVNDTVALSGKPKYIKDMQHKIPPAIKILYPNGGEMLKPGDKATVVWTAEWNGTSTVKLEYNDGTGWKTIHQSAPHNGAFKWTIPSLKSASVKLKVSSADGKVWDESNGNFTVSSNAGKISKGKTAK